MGEDENRQDRGWTPKLILLSIFILCVSIASFILLTQDVNATTYVSGHITTDTTWNISGNPYIVTYDVFVDDNATLTIEAGVEVRMRERVYFHVDGDLIAVGNESDPISFTSDNYNPSRSDWKYVNVRDNGHAFINHCNFSYCYAGVRFDTSSNNTVLNATISNASHGIIIASSSYVTIANSKFWNTSEALSLGTAYNPIKENYNHSISGCTVDGKPLLYYFDKEGITIEDLNAGQIILAWCRDITIDGCNIIDGEGISLLHTTDSMITNCNISSNENGIYVYDFSGTGGINGSMMNSIFNNTFFDNLFGIYLSRSDGNVFRDNQFISNGDGFYSYYSTDNMIFHNNFISNDDQADLYSSYSYPNYFHNDGEGNYWDDYWGEDLGGDGIGDDWYQINYYCHDPFPLMVPWNGTRAPDTTPPYFTDPPVVHDDNVIIPRETVWIIFEASEWGHHEIIIDTDDVTGFDNTTDTVVRGNTSKDWNDEIWNCTLDDGEFIDDGIYSLQMMLWDRAGNPANESFNLGNVSIQRDMDGDGHLDVDDAFPNDPREWSDMDGDGTGDNSDFDRDGDGVENREDDFPNDKSEWRDSDGDDIGDNADPDDNGNNIPDLAEIPLVLFILLIPLLVFHFTNKHVRGKKDAMKEDIEEKKEEEQ